MQHRSVVEDGLKLVSSECVHAARVHSHHSVPNAQSALRLCTFNGERTEEASSANGETQKKDAVQKDESRETKL